ncbi:hypothetical protein H5P28_18525 [Ruficoccus amylovorans]|uniref:Uncharacterized protein n=1 Tax=Ruficoccus amylovorans TaxID=1804625 RepID=A0A842HIT1_9BACT|nr:hypothetical protein [Ruficoccus amylovorans]MBC2596269.1 hypothetical protein [Ruficoccus amylovorans]
MMRKYKVSTEIVTYIWAESPEDAAKYQSELITQEQLTLTRDAQQSVRFSRALGVKFLEAPEDISGTRSPVENPRPLDWLEISQDGLSTVALVRRMSKRRVYYYEAVTGTERSISREAWSRWASNYTLHPRYERVLPPFIAAEAIRLHEDKGLLNGTSATPESSIILAVLEKYGYEPSDWELRNGYWAENAVEKAIAQYILDKTPATAGPSSSTDSEESWGDIQFSSNLPTIDDLEPR